MKLTILLISILLIGCSKEVAVCENITITNTTIEYINTTVIKEVNITCDETARELELIRRLSFCEGQIDKLIINETECMPHNITEEKLQNCENKIDMQDRDIEELEDELEDCEDEVCKWNSSWC